MHWKLIWEYLTVPIHGSMPIAPFVIWYIRLVWPLNQELNNDVVLAKQPTYWQAAHGTHVVVSKRP